MFISNIKLPEKLIKHKSNIDSDAEHFILVEKYYVYSSNSKRELYTTTS